MKKEGTGISRETMAVDSPLKQVLKFLSSMQLGIILLLVLAAISIYATTRQQDEAIQSIYKSWWYVGIMGFAALNLLLCTINRIKPLRRLAFETKRDVSAEEIKRMQVSRIIKAREPGASPLESIKAVFRENGLEASLVEGPDGPVLFAEKGKIGYFGSFITHLSLLFILLAAMYGALTGFETRNGGYAGVRFEVPEGNFAVEIEKVTMEYLPEGPEVRPRVYTDMTITRNGQVIKQGKVSINNPLRFSGVSIYHSTFLWVPHLKVADVESGRVLDEFKLYERGDSRFIHDAGIIMNSVAFFPDFSMSSVGHPISLSYATNNPVLAYQLTYPDGTHEPWQLLPLNQPTVVETKNGLLEITMTGFENAAVFSIAKNLARPYLFLGAVLMVLGLYLCFFLFPRRFYALYDAKSSSYLVGGSGRNRLIVEQVIDRVEEEIRKRGEQE